MAETLTPGLILCSDYELIEPIGKGGMGAIWRARDLPGNRDVALKFVPRDVQNFESEMDRVEDVFSVIHALQHQNICPLYAMKNAGNEFGFFLVMKFIPGLPLGKFARKVRQQTGDFTVSQLVSVLRPIASALDYAHTRRPPVIHRDIKPANILVMTDDDLRVLDVQLIDFGLAATFRASLTRVSQVKLNTSGTRPYMAPEQWDGAYQNAATDQYALGITAYELLSGRFPFASDDFAVLKECVKNAPVPPIETLSAPQNAVLRRALAKTRDERFSTCTAFIKALATAPSEDFSSLEEESTFLDSFNATPAKSALEKLIEEEENLLRQRIADLEEKINEEYRTNHYAEAIIHLKELLQFRPENANARWLLNQAAQKLEFQQKKDADRSAREEADRLEREQKAKAEAQRQERERKAREELERMAGARIVVKAGGIEYPFRWCPPGEFVMGSPKSEPDRDDDEKLHKVKLTRGFWMLETQVTQSMWQSIMDENLSNFKGLQNPVDCVSWNDCQDFCLKLSQKLGQQVKLPTEAQWEYACRAGSTMALPNGPILIMGKNNAPALDSIAWYGGNSSQGFKGRSTWNSKSWSGTQYPGGPCGAHPVAQKFPNAWGLYDMIGNVWEWCSDFYDEAYYDRSPTSDPENLIPSSDRVVRGGSWASGAGYCRSANRFRCIPGNRFNFLGLRIVLVPDQETPPPCLPPNSL